jgi:hypothetical protein
MIIHAIWRRFNHNVVSNTVPIPCSVYAPNPEGIKTHEPFGAETDAGFDSGSVRHTGAVGDADVAGDSCAVWGVYPMEKSPSIISNAWNPVSPSQYNRAALLISSFLSLKYCQSTNSVSE